MFLVSQTDASHQVPSSSPLALVPVIAFVPQPPFAQQAVQGANAQNLTQTFFFAAQSKTLTDGVPDALQLSFQIGKANSVPTDTPCFPHFHFLPLLDRFSRVVEVFVCTMKIDSE